MTGRPPSSRSVSTIGPARKSRHSASTSPSYLGGGWLDDEEEVLEIHSGVIKILIATVLDSESVDVR